MPRFKPSKPGGSTTDPTRYRPPSIAELKELRRNALAYMGIKGGLSQFDAAMVMGRPRRWWEGMELRKAPRRMSFSDWALLSIFLRGEDPAEFNKVLSGAAKRKPFSPAAFIRAIKTLDIKNIDCKRDPMRFCAPTRQEITNLREKVQTADGKELSKTKAALVVGRTLRWWQKLEQHVSKGSPSDSLGFADYALFRILAYGDDPATYAVGLARMLAQRNTGYQANLHSNLPLSYEKKRKHKKAKKKK